MSYNSEEYLQEQINETTKKAQKLGIDIVKQKLFRVALDNDITHKEYLFICESMDKNRDNFKIEQNV